VKVNESLLPAVRECLDAAHLIVITAPGDTLVDVGGVGIAELVPAADGSHERRVSLDEIVPGPLVAAFGASYQVGDRPDIAHRGGSFTEQGPGISGALPG
jgi:hypothetical protein